MSQDNDQLLPGQSGSQPDAGTGGVPAEGTSTDGKRDDGKSTDLSKYVPVSDLNKLRSTMDRKIAEQDRQFKQLSEQYQELLQWREKNETEGLTDEELVAYEAQKAEYEAQNKIAQANQLRGQAEYERNMLALKQYYLSKGAPASIIEMDDPAQMQESFLSFLIDKAKKAEEELGKLKNGEIKDKQPPKVTTHTPAAGTAGKFNWSSVKLGSKEEAELIAAIESGKIKPEDIGL